LANSHCLIADVRLGVGFASSRATSILATSAFTGQPLSRAEVSSERQKTGSRLIDVACPAITTERLTGGA
jgi:hypothetical protein